LLDAMPLIPDVGSVSARIASRAGPDLERLFRQSARVAAHDRLWPKQALPLHYRASAAEGEAAEYRKAAIGRV
jgi:hypothetical protein